MVSVILRTLILAFLVSPVVSLGIHDLKPSLSRIMPEKAFLDRRELFQVVFAAGIVTMVAPTQVRAETLDAFRKSNFNYDLGNGECQTSCVRKCESQASNKNDCIDACVRSGQRYCHQTVASELSPSAQEATTSRYVPTTMEPTIKSSKPIPGLLYNSNRGGAWRDVISIEE